MPISKINVTTLANIRKIMGKDKVTVQNVSKESLKSDEKSMGTEGTSNS
jgi:hypothetical protein